MTTATVVRSLTARYGVRGLARQLRVGPNAVLGYRDRGFLPEPDIAERMARLAGMPEVWLLAAIERDRKARAVARRRQREHGTPVIQEAEGQGRAA